MKKTILLILFLFLFSNIFAQNSLWVKGGYSYTTGLLGAEYFFNELSFVVGWRYVLAAYEDQQVPFYSESKQSFSLGISYYFKGQDKISPYLSGSYAWNGNYDHILLNDEYVIEWGDMISFIGGVRFISRSKNKEGNGPFDFKVGLGYQTMNIPTVGKYPHVAFDFSIGYRIFNKPLSRKKFQDKKDKEDNNQDD